MGRLCPRLRCWVHARPGRETLPARGAGSTKWIATVRASWPVSSYHPARFTEPTHLKLAYRDERSTAGPLPLDTPNPMDPRSFGVRWSGVTVFADHFLAV